MNHLPRATSIFHLLIKAMLVLFLLISLSAPAFALGPGGASVGPCSVHIGPGGISIDGPAGIQIAPGDICIDGGR